MKRKWKRHFHQAASSGYSTGFLYWGIWNQHRVATIQSAVFEKATLTKDANKKNLNHKKQGRTIHTRIIKRIKIGITFAFQILHIETF